MGCTGDSICDNHYPRDYHGTIWILGNITHCQLMVVHPFPIAAAAKAVAATIEEIAETIAAGGWVSLVVIAVITVILVIIIAVMGTN